MIERAGGNFKSKLWRRKMFLPGFDCFRMLPHLRMDFLLVAGGTAIIAKLIKNDDEVLL
jgi:hypothetical protein